MRLTLPQPQIEARVIAAMLTSARWLELGADIESRDFWTWRNRLVFDALRNAQASGAGVSVDAVVDEIEARDVELGTNVSELVGAAFVGLLIVCTSEPLNEEQFFADALQLRLIAESRTLEERRAA